MKLDLLLDESLETPIVRLSNFLPAEAVAFCESLRRLATGEIDCLSVHELPFVIAEDDMQLLFRTDLWDSGTHFVGEHAIECSLTQDSWDDMAGLVEAFESGAAGYHWLYSKVGSPAVLMSLNGCW